MTNVISSTGFDSNGNPYDYLDEDGFIWVYIGKRYGANEWMKSLSKIKD